MYREKPILVLSRCFNGEPVRYDGSSAYDPFVEKLKRYVHIIPVCPEIEIGLGVPRERIFLVKNDGYRIYQRRKDLTELMKNFIEHFFSSIGEVDGFFLKAKSPSCGFSGTKTYRDPDGKIYIGRRKGLFAMEIRKRYSFYPAEDELRIKDFYIRYSFLTRLFLFSQFRQKKDLKIFIEKYSDIMKLYSKKGFLKFSKQSNKKIFYGIFKRNISAKKIEKIYPDFKKMIFSDKKFKERFLIFPEELLDY
ncbi:DUF523 domain-containing protein [Persephonella sp.]